MKTMLDIINALTSLGIVGFLIYFFIYYRKPMKSVLDAIGDTDMLKVGWLEFKRRKQINRDTSKLLSESKKLTSEFEETYDQYILALYKELLATSSLALALSIKTNILDSDNIEGLKALRDKAYHYVNSNESNSAIIALVDETSSSIAPPVVESQESQQSKPDK